MVARAIIHYNEHSGSSATAISKFILDNYKVPKGSFKTQLRLALKRLVAEKELKKPSAASKKYCISASLRNKLKKADKATKKTPKRKLQKIQARAESVLIASAARSGPMAIPRIKANGETSKSKGDLKGTISDVCAVYTLFANKLGINVRKMFTDVHDAKKSDIQQAIKDLFRSSANVKVLYYTGHGKKKTGDWCFNNEGGTEFLSFKDIFDLWDDRRNDNRQKLVIISDCCYSGKVKKAKETKNVIVQAACGSKQKSVDTDNGGLFTQAWVSAAHYESNYLAKLVHAMIVIPVQIWRTWSLKFTPCASISGRERVEVCRLEDSRQKCLRFYNSWKELYLP